MIRGLAMSLLALSLLGGCLVLFVALQLCMIQDAAQVEPQPLTLAALLDKGAGANAHVTISDYLFGQPIVEKQDGATVVWTPLYAAIPGVRHPVRPRALLHMQMPESKIPELLRTPTLTVVVSSQMPAGSSWDVRPPARFFEIYPTEEPIETVILAEPVLRVAGSSWSPSTVFASSVQYGAWALGGVLTLVGLGGLLWMGAQRAGKEISSH